LVGKHPEQGMLKSMVVGVKLQDADISASSARSEGALPATLRFILDPKTLSWQRD
jgi:hypothetical protein